MVTVLRAGSIPTAVVVSEALNRVYVADAGSGFVDSANGIVWVIDGATNTETKIPLGYATLPSSIVVNPTTQEIYVTSWFQGTIWIISGTTVTDTFASGGPGPAYIAVDAVANTVYVANSNPGGPGSITAINGSTHATTTVVLFYLGPNFIATDPLTHAVYVVNSGSNNISVIDGSNPQYPVITTLLTYSLYGSPVVTDPVAVVFNPPYGEFYVASTDPRTTASAKYVGPISIFQ